jgi:hypothetical protein
MVLRHCLMMSTRQCLMKTILDCSRIVSQKSCDACIAEVLTLSLMNLTSLMIQKIQTSLKTLMNLTSRCFH